MCLHSSASKASFKAGVSFSTLLMVMVDETWSDPRPIKSSGHVIMSMVIIPHTSCTILLTNMVDPTSWGRASSSAGGGWDVWLLLRVLVIFANLGGGVHGGALVLSRGASTLGLNTVIPANPRGDFHLCIPGLPGGAFTHWVKIFNTLVFWLGPAGVFTVEGTVSFKCHMPMVGPPPLILVL